MHVSTPTQLKNKLNRKRLLALAVSSALCLTQQAIAQDANSQQEEEAEIIEVRGIADAYRNAIAEKQGATTIVDALSSADIGALPDLSVAETLERIPGVTGDRFKGNASEISIRGLGPFLGFATVNGRAISSGSGNRSVAFSQFPSELVNGVVVYKAQKADILEGGVSGTVDLKTIKPVDYGKERFQAEFKGNYNPYQGKFKGSSGLGSRTSASYTNTYELDGGGEFGFAIGVAISDQSTPEESYNTSSTVRNCNSDAILDSNNGNCNFRDSNAAANGGLPEFGDYYFISNQFLYRQMESHEDRDAGLIALQWKPNDDLDINLDGQVSKRFFFEDRHDLTFDDGRRRIANWVTDDNNVLQSYTGNSRIGSLGHYRERDENYEGLGLNIDWQATDDLRVYFDAAFSGTVRDQIDQQVRLRSDRAFYDWENSDGSFFPQITNVYADINDPEGSAVDFAREIQALSYFDADSRISHDQFEIRDTINSYTLDFDYGLDHDNFYNLKFGAALSTRKHGSFDLLSPQRRNTGSISTEVQRNCGRTFPQRDFGDDGQLEFENWATFDTLCAFDLLAGEGDISEDPKIPDPSDINLSEEVTSFYVMGEFSAEIGDIPVDGNIGVRYVTTDIESVGINSTFRSVTNDNGIIDLETVDGSQASNVLKNSYSNLLPSINVSFGLTEELQLRAAAYGAISRPDMWFYGAARSVTIDPDDEPRTIPDALINSVTANGNPFLEALESDNYDLSLSYFLGQDTLISAAIYYKEFNARFDIGNGIEPIIVDGTSFDADVGGRVTIVDDSSSINGYEISALHTFDAIEGLGISLNYNFANSDFETPEAGSAISDVIRNQIAPANISGLSKHNFSGQIYWENDVFSTRLSYKYRSRYLKPFGPNLAQTNRFVRDQRTLDFDASYKINDSLKARFQVINLTNEAYVEERVAATNFNRVEFSGPRIFLGIQYRK
jgi:TonB-dependent receptor